jgi:hypothetical protein
VNSATVADVCRDFDMGTARPMGDVASEPVEAMGPQALETEERPVLALTNRDVAAAPEATAADDKDDEQGAPRRRFSFF